MPEWLVDSLSPSADFSLELLAVRLMVAALFGGCVAAIYRLSHGRQKSDSSVLVPTLVLLSVLIAMVSMVVGNNVARAFSLVGALSIVRFRTVVEDTRDTAFVIFAVIVGMGAGAGMFLVPLVGIPIVGAAAVLLSRAPANSKFESPSAALTIRIGLGRDPEQALDPALDRYLDGYRITAVSTARQGAAIEIGYLVRLRQSATLPALVAELNQIEGVQSVEIKS